MSSATLTREPVQTTTTAAYLSPAQTEELAARLDALRAEVLASRAQADADYIRRVIAVQRGLEVAGRALLFAGVLPPAWIAGTAALSVAKILENMEIGHNVLHGQWDWMRDPKIHSTTWEWDTASPSDAWKHSHNYVHHTFTNVVGKDNDVGYGIMRLSEDQRWHPAHLGQPVYNLLLSLFFEWGVALHDLDVAAIRRGEKDKRTALAQLRDIGRKVRRQATKDYLVFPALAGPFFAPVLAGNLVANLVRNVWAHAVIFCGHFPTGVAQFRADQLESETKGEWYVRQLLGSANLTGGRLFDVMAGNLSYQIEHHLFPDLPSNRYAEIAPAVRALCEEYGLPYVAGSLPRQYADVVTRIARLSLPPGRPSGARS